MSESIGGIHYDLDLKDQDFKKKAKDADGVMGGLKKSFQKAEDSSKALLTSIVALGAGLIAFGISSVNAYNEANRAETKLVQLHHDNTGATMKQTRELINQANALQKLGVVEGDAIINGQAQLATFKLSTSAIKSLTPAMTDMVAHIKGANATGEDFVNIGNLIGKVMEGNIGALGRYGVSFNKNQEDILKNGNEQERAATLAKILEQNYGGVNKALRDTPEGKLASIKNRFGDLQEQLGELVLKSIDPLITQYDILLGNIEESGGIVETVTKIYEDHKEAIYVISGAILVALVPALVALASSLWATVAPLLPFIAIGALLGLIVYKLVNVFGGWAPLIDKIKDSFSKWWNTLQPLVSVLLNGVVVALQSFLIPALERLWNFIAPVLIPVLGFLLKVLQVLAVTIFIVLVGAIQAIIIILALIIDLFIALVKWVINLVVTIIKWIPGAWNAMKDWFKGIGEWIGKVINWFKELPGKIGDMLKGIGNAIKKPFEDAFNGLKGKLEDIKNKINDALNPFVRHSPSLVDWVERGSSKIEESYENMFDRLGEISAQNRNGMIGGVKSVVGMNSEENQGGNGKGGVVNNITIPLSGIIARTPGELREIGLEIKKVVDQALNSNGGNKVKIIR